LDATYNFEVGGREYHLSSPSPLQIYASRHLLAIYTDAIAFPELGEIKRVVDVGACIGMMSLAFNAAWPDAEIIALEPHPITFKHLEANCRGIKNIHPICMAASDKEETIRLATPSIAQYPKYPMKKRWLNVGMTSRYGLSDNYVAEAKAMPLDKIVTGPVDFIKIDVEGAELTVLAGAKEIINKWHPFMMIELSGKNLALTGKSVANLLADLTRLGYFTGARIFGDALFCHVDRLPCYS
jgi:FkbM family methyltransferase